MAEPEKSPQGRRRGPGARERILGAAQQLFRDQGIHRTGMDQLCAAAEVSKGTAYQHFTGKDELVAEYLRRVDPDVMPAVFDRTDLTPRERLLAAVEGPAPGTQDITPLCPFIGAAFEIPDPQHPAAQYARDYKQAVAARLAETAREAGAPTPSSSASSWRCLSTAPRPAPGSSTPNPSYRRRYRRRPHRQRHPRDSPGRTAEIAGLALLQLSPLKRAGGRPGQGA